MRILLITEFYPGKGQTFSGGVETRTYFTAKYLALKNEVSIICRRKNNEPEKENSGNITIYRLGKNTISVEAKVSTIFSRLLFMFQAFIKAKQIQADIVEGSNFICLLPAYFIGRLKKISVVAWYPDIYGKEWIRNFGPVTGIFGLLLEKAGLLLPWSHIIALSHQTETKLLSEGIKADKVSVIYGGVELSFISGVKAKKVPKPTVCCISRLVAYKDVDVLLRALALVKKEIPEINCLVIGKGPERSKLNRLVKDLNLQKNIKFIKNINYLELITKLKSSHVFCLPSRIEGFGLVTIEAMACKLPFIVADLPVNKEITGGKGGYFFKAGNFSDLADKICKLLVDRQISKDFVSAGQGKISNYVWDHIAGQTEEVYRTLLKTAPKKL